MVRCTHYLQDVYKKPDIFRLTSPRNLASIIDSGEQGCIDEKDRLIVCLFFIRFRNLDRLFHVPSVASCPSGLVTQVTARETTILFMLHFLFLKKKLMEIGLVSILVSFQHYSSRVQGLAVLTAMHGEHSEETTSKMS